MNYNTTNNILRVRFSEDEKEKYVKNILDYLHYTDPVYYYLFFGYGDGNLEMDQYYEKYPELLKDKGFINLREEDFNNYQLISDLLYEYQFASLYINKRVNLDQKWTYIDIRDNNYSLLFEGYIILSMGDKTIVLDKDDNLPTWDFEKMGITEDMVY